ncbi:Protein kinase domain containing protein, partial [Metarhizium brunneum ARSEF 3297]
MYSLSGGRIGSVWSREADIWAIGSIAYQIKTGCQLFLVQGDLQYQLYQALRLGGAPPEDWSEFWDLEKFCESTKGRRKPVLPVFNKDEAWKSRRPRNDPESEVFLDFIRKMVITEPERRSQIAELLGHPFLS